MKNNRSLLISLVLLILVAALYRIIPNRPWGFAPQIAMALFGGAVIKDRKWAFALPIFSMFLSDCLYELLYRGGISTIQGFYEGQFTNYLLFAGITLIGFMIKKVNLLQVGIASLAAPLVYFVASNGVVWLEGGGLQRPKTFAGLLQTYADGLPFLQGSILSTIVFSAVLFGGYYLLRNNRSSLAHA